MINIQYSSGKTRFSRYIADEIFKRENKSSEQDCKRDRRERERESKGTLVSLFCGGLSVETKLQSHFSKIICNDKQEYLISLYKAVQNGWLPPEELTEEEYKYIKNHKDENKALTGFVGFGCSFGGKWFGAVKRAVGASAFVSYKQVVNLVHVLNLYRFRLLAADILLDSALYAIIV